MSVKYHYKDFKTILNKLKFIDNYFWCRYTLNPYNGCEFACNYCDSHSHKYHLHSEFDHVIYVKTNVGTMLDNRIRRARTLLPDVVAIGGTCDAYQPAEAEYGSTRTCLEVLLKHHYPVSLSTKSELILRDLDLLSIIAADTWCTIGITVTTVDEELAAFLEPNAPGPHVRLDTLRHIKEKAPNIQVGIHLMPIVPYLGDSEESLESVVYGAKMNGADFILFGAGMTMRDNQAMWFYNKLGSKFPHLVRRYEEMYQAKFDPETGYTGRYAPLGTYSRKINRQMLALCETHNINYFTKRYIPKDFRYWNYIVAETFLHESLTAQLNSKAWTNLFWAGQNIQSLSESIVDIAGRGDLQTIRNVGPALENRILELIANR